MGEGALIWGYIPASKTWVPIEVDADGTLRAALVVGGHSVSPAHPIPVTGVITATTLTVDSFTNTVVGIVPATVRSSAIDAFKAAKVHCHFAAPTSNPITIALDAAAGADYDKPLHVQTMGASRDMDYYFPEGAKFEAGDVITVEWANDIGGARWSVQIGWEE